MPAYGPSSVLIILVTLHVLACINYGAYAFSPDDLEPSSWPLNQPRHTY